MEEPNDMDRSINEGDKSTWKNILVLNKEVNFKVVSYKKFTLQVVSESRLEV
jgi:hypothetical protein